MAEEKTNFGKRWKARFHRYCLAFMPNEPNAILLAILLGIGLNTLLLYFIDLPKDTTLFEYLRDSKPWALITGLTAAPALILMWYWRDKHRRADIEKGREDVRIARESQLTERFATAVRLLGDERMEIRLGGIYALERLARDSEADHWAVMETLSAFIRENARREGYEWQVKEEAEKEIKPRTDIQAALTVIGRRPEERRKYEEKKGHRIDLSGTDLRGADISRAYLKCIDLHSTKLIRANLTGADLSGEKLYFTDLSGASFFGADLSGALLFCADLSGASFSGADLPGALFFGTDLYGADFSRANLTDAKFKDAKYTSKDRNAGFSPATEFPPGFDPKAHGMIDVTPDEEADKQKA